MLEIRIKDEFMNGMSIKEIMRKYGVGEVFAKKACLPRWGEKVPDELVRDYVRFRMGKTLEEIYTTCERGEWLLWHFSEVVGMKRLIRIKCNSIRNHNLEMTIGKHLIQIGLDVSVSDRNLRQIFNNVSNIQQYDNLAILALGGTVESHLEFCTLFLHLCGPAKQIADSFRKEISLEEFV